MLVALLGFLSAKTAPRGRNHSSPFILPPQSLAGRAALADPFHVLGLDVDFGQASS